MARRQREWARRTRDFLRDFFGGKCARCDETNPDLLEFDTKTPTGHDHHRICWPQRMSFYKKQFRLNNLQLLCKKCNAKKAGHEDQEYYDNHPF